MNIAARLWRLDAADWSILTRAVAAVATARVAVWTMPFARLASFAEMAPAEHGDSAPSPDVAKIAWAVNAAGRLIPGGGTCLVRAVAAKRMLSRSGYGSELRIGVAHDQTGKFSAHAWVEAEGRAVVGDFREGEFVMLRKHSAPEARK